MGKVLFLLVVFVGHFAQAESFICQGTGRFAGIKKRAVTLTWNSLDYQKVLLEEEGVRVQVNVDKANTDGSQYLGIEVLETDPQTHQVSFKGAKGSLHDMVMYIEGASCVISCVPVKENPSLNLRF